MIKDKLIKAIDDAFNNYVSYIFQIYAINSGLTGQQNKFDAAMHNAIVCYNKAIEDIEAKYK